MSKGVVTLVGAVPTFAAHRAVLARSWLPGVVAVDARRLRVAWRLPPKDGTTPDPIDDDQRVAASVAGALAAEPRVGPRRVAVDVAGGVAILRGALPTMAARRAAESTARETAGVRRVVNEIQVERQPGDAEIARRVAAALARDPYVDRRTITVRVLEGHVHLVGTVDAPFEIERAAQIAAQVPGVVRITNALELSGGVRPAPRSSR